MATVNINGQEYNTDEMSDEAKATVISLQFVQAELRKLEAQIAVHKTAEKAYALSLKESMENK